MLNINRLLQTTVNRLTTVVVVIVATIVHSTATYILWLTL